MFVDCVSFLSMPTQLGEHCVYEFVTPTYLSDFLVTFYKDVWR